MALYGQADPVSQSAFRDFFGVRLILDYVYSCSETDFYEKKKSFSSNYKNSQFLLTAAALSQNGRIAV